MLLRDRHGRFLGEVAGTSDGTGQVDPDAGYGYWPIVELPERVVAATLAVEDRRFRRHPGVDARAVGRALVQNLGSAERVSGASTLAMQVARMQQPGARTYANKALEALTALALTGRHGRDAVLCHYLRIVPYGNQVYGIRYAARRYLDKPVEDLSWAEVAFLAAIPQSPSRHNPFRPLGKARATRRGLHILDLLHGEGHLNDEEYQLARRQIRQLRIPEREQRPEEALHAVLYLHERLRRPDLPAAERERLQHAPRVTTTLDLDIQRTVTWHVRNSLDAWQSRGAGNAAVIVLDRRSCEVLAWVGSSSYFDDSRAGAIDYARIERSPGSTLKPFLYALALERGRITPATVLDDLDRGPSGVGNADHRFLGPQLPRVALGNSRNVPAVVLLRQLGLDEVYSHFADLGLHDHSQSGRYYGLGLAIGALPVSLERLMTAYTALANDGLLGELVWVAGDSGPERRVLSESTARQIALFLADPMARLPSFPRMGHAEYPFPVAVKTGTSSQYRDAWAVAWSERYLVGAWVGHPDYRPMQGLSGYRAGASLVHSILISLHPDQLDGLEDVPFPPPRGYESVRLCALTGALASPACDRVTREWFAPGQAPVDPCTAHILRAIDRRNGLLAGGHTPTAEVEIRPFVQLPPRYASWAVAVGLIPPPQQLSPLDLDPVSARALPRFDGQIRPATSLEPPRLTLTSPEPEAQLLRDPEMPADRATLALKVVVDPRVEQVLWLVDGQPYQLVDYPYTARWPLVPGRHSFQVEVPYRDARSRRVWVTVQ